jgi:hypothetical protein
MTDEIVTEVRHARAQLAARFDFDLTRIIADASSRDLAIRAGTHGPSARPAKSPKQRRKLKPAGPEPMP